MSRRQQPVASGSRGVAFSAPRIGSTGPNVSKISLKGKEKEIIIKATVQSSESSKSEEEITVEKVGSKSISLSSSPALDDFDSDLSHPHNLPEKRRRETLKRIEFGNYTTALHDVISSKYDLANVMYTWESVRLAKSLSEENDEEEDVPEGKFPLLRAQALRKAVRWPIVPGDLPQEDFALGDELQGLISKSTKKSQILQQKRGSGKQLQEKKKRAKSAYGSRGPLEKRVDQRTLGRRENSPPSNLSNIASPIQTPVISESENSESEAELNSDDSDDLDFRKTKVISRVATILDSLLLNMASLAPPCHFPPTDLWSARKMKDSWRSKIPESSLDHMDVINLIESLDGVPEGLVGQLRAQLSEIYEVPDAAIPAAIPALPPMVDKLLSTRSTVIAMPNGPEELLVNAARPLKYRSGKTIDRSSTYPFVN